MNKLFVIFLIFLKSLLDAIGTSSGLSWPTLGLLAGALLLSAGSSFMIGLCIAVATIFTIAVTYIFIASFVNNIKEWQSLNKEIEHYEDLAFQYDAYHLLNYRELHKKNTPFFVKFTAFFITFAGIHGTIAGTTLGIITLLTSLGLIAASFAAFSIVAGVALGVGLAGGITLALIASAQASQNYQKKVKLEHLKSYVEIKNNEKVKKLNQQTVFMFSSNLSNEPEIFPSPAGFRKRTGSLPNLVPEIKLNLE